MFSNYYFKSVRFHFPGTKDSKAAYDILPLFHFRLIEQLTPYGKNFSMNNFSAINGTSLELPKFLDAPAFNVSKKSTQKDVKVL